MRVTLHFSIRRLFQALSVGLIAANLMLSQVTAAAVIPELPSSWQQNGVQVEPSPTGRYFIMFEGPSALEKTGANKGQVQSALVQNEVAGIRAAQVQQLKTFEKLLGRKLPDRKHFDLILNAVALELSLEEAGLIAAQPGVKAVVPVRIKHLATDAGPTWVEAPQVWQDPALIASTSSMGEGVIIGVLDTGINFDHPSFASDPVYSGYDFPTPSQYFGVCKVIAGLCNNKVIGAYYISGGTGSMYNIPPEDINGHGSHTASTAAGNQLQAVSYKENIVSVSGMAPHAQLIVYDVCHFGCDDLDIVTAIEQAVLDGVDVLNYSIANVIEILPSNDPVAMAFLDAFNAGIFVSASAGNASSSLGPTEGLVKNISQWVTSVAATSHDRQFQPQRVVNSAWGDIRADFSLQGPAMDHFELLKPDLAAPGINILAADRDGVVDQNHAAETRIMSGTSMSTPFVAGAAALLISAHPDWTPAEVKSALMLTAKTDEVYKNDAKDPADPFDIGAGRIQVDKAVSSGLVMNETYDNMTGSDPAHGGDPKTLNLSTLQNNYCWPNCSWTRTVRNPTTSEQTYKVTSPESEWISVEPAPFTVAAGATQTLTITAQTDSQPMYVWKFAQIDLTPEPNPTALPTLHFTLAVFTAQLIYYYFPYIVN